MFSTVTNEHPPAFGARWRRARKRVIDLERLDAHSRAPMRRPNRTRRRSSNAVKIFMDILSGPSNRTTVRQSTAARSTPRQPRGRLFRVARGVQPIRKLAGGPREGGRRTAVAAVTMGVSHARSDARRMRKQHRKR